MFTIGMIILIVLENDNRELDSIQVSSTDVAIRILRPYIVQILYKYGVMGEFLFVSNGGCIEFEKELTTTLKTAITSVNGTNSLIIRSIKAMQSVRSVQTVQTMPAVQPVQTMQAVQAVQTVQAVQPVHSVQSVQSAQPVHSVQSLYPPMYSEYSQFPFPYGKAGFTPMAPLNGLPSTSEMSASTPSGHREASAMANDHTWEYYGNENALQRLLREAKANGQVDEIASHPLPSNADLGLDDAPRELASRNNSNLRFGSYENLYSRNGSMVFPTSSRPGSMVFNPLGSNVSLDFRETSNPMMEELMNRMHDGEYDDIDKGAPAL